MTAQIKITQLTEISTANLVASALLPVVNMTGVPTTQKATFGNVANVILSGAGGDYNAAGLANLAYSVVNASQPNITSVGTLTSLNVSGAGGANITANLSAGNISTSGNISGKTNGYTIGYLNIPQVEASNVTLALSDAGKHYYSTTDSDLELTIPDNATTSFETGTTISIVVQAAGNILVNAANGVTLYMAGNAIAANRVVGPYGMATLMKVATDTWFINGTGVS